MTEIRRRSLFAAAGGALLAGHLAGCAPGTGTEVRRRKGGPLPGRVDHVPTVCLQCPAGCGILVRRVDGVPVQIRGNPEYPTNQGGVCPKGAAGLQVLYDPDRIPGPLRRAGPRGSGEWTPVAWEEALDEVARRLREIREGTGNDGVPHPEGVVFMGGRFQGSMEPLARSFLSAYGSPNHLGNGSVGSDGTPAALEMMQGVRDYPGFDWESVNYVLSFGASWLEAFRPTAYLLRAFGHLRRGRPGMRAKFVQVDPRFGVTSAKADEWVPIRPTTDAALALGMAHVIVDEGLWDREFVEEHTFGFEDWEDASGRHKGFRRHVLEGYPPERVAEITGVEAERIVRLAREFAGRRPSFALGERGVSMQTNGLYTRMAVHSLNALVGSVNRPGGVLVQAEPPLRPFPPPVLDDVARAGVARSRIDGAGTRRWPVAGEVSQALADAVLADGAPPVDLLFLYYTNPLFSRTNGRDFRRAFADAGRVRCIVSFSPFLDESTAMADLVLPDHTYLERWQDVPVPASVGYPVVGIRRPVVEKPLHDTRSTGDVLLDLGRRVGGTVAESLPWKDFRALVEWRLGGAAAVEGASVRAGPEPGFVRAVENAGGWWDARTRFRPWDEVFRTPSGRFEFWSQTLRDRLGAVLGPEDSVDALLEELAVEARGDDAYLPHYEPARFQGDPAEYPLHLNTFKPMVRAEGRGANQPYLQDLGVPYLRESWSTWLEINPATARGLGVADGDMVVVEGPPVPGSDEPRSIRVRARHWEGVRPDTVNIPFDQGHRGYGRWASETGANPNDVMVRDEDRLTGQSAYFGSMVRVRRA